MSKLLQSAYNSLIAPRASDEDGRRREFILNVLLVGSLILVVTACLIVWLNFLFLGTNTLPGVYALTILMWFVTMFVLSRRGGYVASAYMLIGTFGLLAFYSLAKW